MSENKDRLAELIREKRKLGLTEEQARRVAEAQLAHDEKTSGKTPTTPTDDEKPSDETPATKGKKK